MYFQNLIIFPNINSIAVKQLCPLPTQPLATPVLLSVSVDLTSLEASHQWSLTVFVHLWELKLLVWTTRAPSPAHCPSSFISQMCVSHLVVAPVIPVCMPWLCLCPCSSLPGYFCCLTSSLGSLKTLRRRHQLWSCLCGILFNFSAHIVWVPLLSLRGTCLNLSLDLTTLQGEI